MGAPLQLARAILKLRDDSNWSIEKLARELNTSTKTVMALLAATKEKTAASALKISKTASIRMRAAKAETYSRIFRRLSETQVLQTGIAEMPFSLASALNEFGLDLEKDSAVKDGAKRAAIASTGSGGAVRRVGRISSGEVFDEDAVIDNLPVDKNGRKTIIARIFKWPPFIPEGDTNPTGEGTPGAALAKSWVGTVNPIDWNVSLGNVLETFDGSLISLKRGADPATSHNPDVSHVVFGLYETTYRRMKGASFISLPGLGVGLGGTMSIAASKELFKLFAVEEQKHGESFHLWGALLNKTPKLIAGNFVVLTWRGEVGDLFCRGLCQLREGDKYHSYESEEVILDQFVHLIRSGDHPILIADRVFSGIIRKKAHSALISKRDDLTKDKNKLISFVASGPESDLESESEQSRALIKSFVENTLKFSPIYRVGAAVHKSARRLKEYLEDALLNDLIYNASALTGNLFAELLLGSKEMTVTAVTDSLAPEHEDRLRKSTVQALTAKGDNASSENEREIIRLRIEAIEAHWKLIPKKLTETNEGNTKNGVDHGTQ